MVDVSLTESQVQPASGYPIKWLTAGGTITQGQPIYKDANDQAQPAQADAAGTAEVIGIALCAASDGQPVAYQSGGTITLGAAASLTVGEHYVLSAAAAGGVAPEGDLVSTNYVTPLGTATSASALKLAINVTGAQVP